MRITFLLSGPAWAPGGSHRVVFEYSNRLVRRGHLVTLAFPLDPGLSPAAPGTGRKRITLRHLRWWMRGTHVPWFDVDSRIVRLKLARLAGDRMPSADVVCATWWPLAVQLPLLPARAGKPFFLIHHDDVESGYDADRVRQAWRLPCAKLVVSRFVQEKVRSLGSGLVSYVPNAVDHEVFRVQSDIDERPPAIAFAYSEKPIKDSTTALSALAQARKSHKVCIRAFGTTRAPKDLPPWVEYHRQPTDVVLAGRVYNRSSIFVSSSRVEGFGLCGAEAMACGCALVSTDSGGVREYAEDSVTALLTAPGDADGLARNILRMVDDDRFRRILACQGVQRVQQFTWDRSVDALERAFLHA